MTGAPGKLAILVEGYHGLGSDRDDVLYHVPHTGLVIAGQFSEAWRRLQESLGAICVAELGQVPEGATYITTAWRGEHRALVHGPVMPDRGGKVSDLVVTVPQDFWPEWIAEGDAAGTAPTGEEWGFYVSGRPPITPGERLYIVAHNRLRGYAPVMRVVRDRGDTFAICRRAGAVAVTIPERIRGFQGFRSRWWGRDEEVPFPDWMVEDVPDKFHPDLGGIRA